MRIPLGGVIGYKQIVIITTKAAELYRTAAIGYEHLLGYDHHMAKEMREFRYLHHIQVTFER